MGENPKVILSKEEKFEILESIADTIGDSFSFKDIKIIAEKSDYSLEKVKVAYEIMQNSKTKIDDQTAWMISAIENNYQKGKSRKVIKSYANANENISELEALLLDN